MRDANEELRVGAGDGGRLFRKAMMKNGIWGVGGSHVGGGDGGSGKRAGGVPIEYARGLVEWVGSIGGLGLGTTAGQGEGQEGGEVSSGKEAKIWDYGWKRY
jgi:hypothetical protein